MRPWYRWVRVVLLGVALMPAAPAFARDAQARVVGTVELTDLPREARKTYSLIRQGGPFPYSKDGTVFGNRERFLPRRERGYYTEYTVNTPGERTRGARRIIVGGNPRSSDEYYYTEDHYQSFKRIRE